MRKKQKAAAIVIGDDLVKRHNVDVGPCDGAEREPNRWVLTYPRTRRDGEVTDPSHVIVLVDVVTGEARFIDAM